MLSVTVGVSNKISNMEAVQFDPRVKELSLVKIPVPSTPQGNLVVVQVAYSGICGTDLHIAEVSEMLIIIETGHRNKLEHFWVRSHAACFRTNNTQTGGGASISRVTRL